MQENDIQEAIERNADIIVITCFVVIDLVLTGYAVNHSMHITTVPNTSQIQAFEMKRVFLDTRLLNGLVMIKSLVMYMIAFQVSRRLPTQ